MEDQRIPQFTLVTEERPRRRGGSASARPGAGADGSRAQHGRHGEHHSRNSGASEASGGADGSRHRSRCRDYGTVTLTLRDVPAQEEVPAASGGEKLRAGLMQGLRESSDPYAPLLKRKYSGIKRLRGVWPALLLVLAALLAAVWLIVHTGRQAEEGAAPAVTVDAIPVVTLDLG